MPGLIMGTMMLISLQFTFGLNLLFVFGDEDINRRMRGLWEEGD